MLSINQRRRLCRGAILNQPDAPLLSHTAGKQQSPLRKAASIVGGVLGAPGAVRGWVSEQSPVAAAAHYLGVDSVNLNVDTLKGW